MARRRRHRLVGAITLVVAAALTIGAFQLDNIVQRFTASGYSAQLRDAAGLTSGVEVRVAGVRVGEVTGVDLAGVGTDTPHVKVDFRVDSDVFLGDQTSASVRIKTVLGQRYLAVEPAGERPLPDDRIPLARTATPLDVVNAVNDLADTADQIDTEQLADALSVLSETFADTPDNVQGAVDGLSRLSITIASRDEELGALLESTRTVTTVVAERNAEFEQLIINGNLLLDELDRRADAIHDLLVATEQLSLELQGLVDDQEDRLAPMLAQLDGVVDLLNEHSEDLTATLQSAGPFIQAFSNVTGNGRWFDSYIEGLLQPYVPEVG